MDASISPAPAPAPALPQPDYQTVLKRRQAERDLLQVKAQAIDIDIQEDGLKQTLAGIQQRRAENSARQKTLQDFLDGKTQ